MHNLVKPISLMAFDFGLKQIGVAYGQTVTKQAKGLTIIKAQDGTPNWITITGLIDKWQPNILLVGLPLNMDSSESELSGRARKFAPAIIPIPHQGCECHIFETLFRMFSACFGVAIVKKTPT